MIYTYESLNALRDSLHASGVLSDDYRGLVMQYALSVATEAHAAGVEKGREQERRVTNPPPQRFHSDALKLDVLRCRQSSADEVRIGYVDSYNDYTERRIRVLSLRYSDRRGTYIVSAYDVDKDAPRTFRLDNIEWVEVDPA